ncbi:hypothetical protein CXT84_04660 [Akkermansia muciniphila]|nr:hypothetical protein CXT84_04660 [Akkermansia muciniphila]
MSRFFHVEQSIVAHERPIHKKYESATRILPSLSRSARISSGNTPPFREIIKNSLPLIAEGS